MLVELHFSCLGKGISSIFLYPQWTFHISPWKPLLYNQPPWNPSLSFLFFTILPLNDVFKGLKTLRNVKYQAEMEPGMLISKSNYISFLPMEEKEWIKIDFFFKCPAT